MFSFSKTFNQLKHSMLSHAPLSCPNCGSKPSVIPADPNEVVVCPRCKTGATLAEWASHASAHGFVGDPDVVPVGSKITRTPDHLGTTVWEIPASRKSGGFLVFGVIWTLFTAVLSIPFLGAFFFGKFETRGGSIPAWAFGLGLVAFFSIFWAIGLGMLYVALRNKYATHRLAANRDTITLTRQFFGRKNEKTLAVEPAMKIAQVEFYQSNGQPVRGIEMKTSRGKLRFGSMLSDAEKAWLVVDLRRAALGEEPLRSNQENAGSPLMDQSQSTFSIEVPDNRKSKLSIGILFALMGGVFLVLDYLFILPKTDELMFKIVWSIISGIAFLTGLSLLISYFRSRDHVTHIEGTQAEIAIRTTRHGLLLKEQTFPREQVTDVRTDGTARQNGKPMKNVNLIVGKKAVKVASWLSEEQADDFVRELRRVL